MIEPMSARDLFTIGYAAFVIFGGVYVLSSVLLLSEHWKRGKRKGKR